MFIVPYKTIERHLKLIILFCLFPIEYFTSMSKIQTSIKHFIIYFQNMAQKKDSQIASLFNFI